MAHDQILDQNTYILHMSIFNCDKDPGQIIECVSIVLYCALFTKDQNYKSGVAIIVERS